MSEKSLTGIRHEAATDLSWMAQLYSQMTLSDDVGIPESLPTVESYGKVSPIEAGWRHLAWYFCRRLQYRKVLAEVLAEHNQPQDAFTGDTPYGYVEIVDSVLADIGHGIDTETGETIDPMLQGYVYFGGRNPRVDLINFSAGVFGEEFRDQALRMQQFELYQ